MSSTKDQERRWDLIWMPHKKLTTEEIMDNYRNNEIRRAPCLWCGRARENTKHHDINVKDGSGPFPCCEDCWSIMSLEDKIECIKHLYLIWMEDSEKYSQYTLEELIEAVKKEI